MNIEQLLTVFAIYLLFAIPIISIIWYIAGWFTRESVPERYELTYVSFQGLRLSEERKIKVINPVLDRKEITSGKDVQ